MYTLSKIIQSVEMSYALSEEEGYFGFTLEIGENTFTFEDVHLELEYGVQLFLEGQEISDDNLVSMFFKVDDGKFMSLGAIYEKCLPVAATLADSWREEELIDQAMEDEYIQEISSPFLTGRL